jgi:putative ABC transport system permease protein
VGVLGRTGTIVDRLVLTSVESYWKVHPPAQTPAEGELVTEPPIDEGRTVSALLIQYNPGADAPDFVRYVNSFGDLQSASPAEETARIFGVSAVGMDLLRGFALVLMISAAFSIFIALYNGISERRYDLAVMRALGATRERIMALLLFEGAILSLVGGAIGLALGHVFTSVLGVALRQAQQVSVTGWTWYTSELAVIALSLAVGVATALVPAWRAHEIDIAETLARG